MAKKALPKLNPAKTLRPKPAVAPNKQQSDEYDRRGVKLPARTLVGGIITPM